ncbi:MAG TPA: TolC family protein [Bacteroidia bacterium]|nr:TolC family protein [Bacteroidia bacterium]
MKLNHLSTLICFFIFSCIWGQAPDAFNQDTVHISIPDAEQRFVSKNLSLLISQYDTKIAQANYLQAKLWYNPNIYYGTTLYNQDSKKFFDNGYPSQGQVDNTIQLQQLLTIGGRHSATAKLAKVGVKQAQFQLADLLRSLKYQMYTDLSDLFNNQSLVKMYQVEEAKIKHLIEITQILYSKGNAAGEDVIRLQAQYQDVIAQETTSQQAVNNDEQDLRILLAYPGKTYIVANVTIPASVQLPAYQVLVDSAKKNRPDLMLASAGIEYNDKNLSLQNATAIPDLTLGVANIGAGSVVPSYWGISASMDLPVFSRNQWSITAARYGRSQAQINDSLVSITVESQVTTSFCNLYRLNDQLNQIDSHYEQNLDDMMNNAFTNYEKRYISLLDFLSETTTYIDGKTNLINLRMQYFNAIHNLNYTTGIDIIK